MSPDAAASIRARLLNLAKKQGEEFELSLVRYSVERFLYRLGESPMQDRLVLKGAALLSVWMNDPYRASRDVDLLAAGSIDEDEVRAMVKTVCTTQCDEDGIRFDVDGIEVSRIREENAYGGLRAMLFATLAGAKIRMQIDFGFGDDVVPDPELTDYPRLLETVPAPRVLMYPRVVTVAEKFEAMVKLGRRNSRMKDYHDVWALSGMFAFDGAALQRAIASCIERRGTDIVITLPDALTSAFYQDQDLQARWANYLRSGSVRVQPSQRFEEIGERVIGFLKPVRDAIASGRALQLTWAPAEEWR